MRRGFSLSVLALSLTAAPLAADPVGAPANEPPLTIEIGSGLTFSRLALTGKDGGSAAIDPQSGARSTDGGLVALGGMAVQGRARITGVPLRAVRVDLPRTVTMSTANGGEAILTDLATDLPAWPTLDATGTLEFSFGGRLTVPAGASGRLRGRIPISVDYN
jgi:hypothetical protein